MQGFLDLLALVGMVMFVMVLVFSLWGVIFAALIEVLWYIAMAFIFMLFMGAALNFLSMVSRLFRFGSYKRC